MAVLDRTIRSGCFKGIGLSNIKEPDLSVLLITKKQKFCKMIKINKRELEVCQYCNSKISIEYDIKCLGKSIIYWTYKLSQESEKSQGNEWDSSYEMLMYRQKQQKYLKDELVKLKTIYNLD